jgi:hypothetical protein
MEYILSQYPSIYLNLLRKKQGNISKNNLSLDQETNPGLLEYEAGILTLQKGSYIGCSFCRLIRRPEHLIGRLYGISRQTEGPISLR